MKLKITEKLNSLKLAIDRQKELESSVDKFNERNISNEENNIKLAQFLSNRKESLDEASSCLDSLKIIYDKNIQSNVDNFDSNILSELSGKIDQSITKLNEGNKKISEIIDILTSDKSNNFIMFNSDGNFNILKMLSSYQDFVSNLSLLHLNALINIITGIFVLLCLSTIVFVHYGEFLINYFKMEDKFPKLAKYIQLRRKFQQYYFIVNVLLIIIVLVLMIYANILLFINLD